MATTELPKIFIALATANRLAPDIADKTTKVKNVKFEFYVHYLYNLFGTIYGVRQEHLLAQSTTSALQQPTRVLQGCNNVDTKSTDYLLCNKRYTKTLNIYFGIKIQTLFVV